jgi:hypothetical protein
MEINWFAWLIATIVAIAVGALWFGPRTFFPLWWKAMGKDASEQPGGSSMATVFGLTFIATSLYVAILALVVSALDVTTWGAGLLVGAMMGVLVAAVTLPHKLFGSIRLSVWVLEASSDFLALALAGLILGAMGP